MTRTQALERTTLAACRGVSVVYGSGSSAVHALDAVDLEIEPCSGVALVGRSGSGKTTLLHVLGGLVEPTAGRVEWHGQPLSSLDAAARGEARARGIAYVFQGANLLPRFTAFENVAFAVRVAGGEAQRVALARALAQSPEVLLCDEPTGHLDSDTGERILDLIEALQREFGFALVLATHDPDVAARLGRAVELHDGRIAPEPEDR